MAHFAELNQNNEVIQVIIISNQDILDETGKESEEVGINFCKSLYGSDKIWKQTSYNNSFRKRYAGIGMSYNEELDAFIPPQPYPSWILDFETVDWQAPIPQPELSQEQITSGLYYQWDEDSRQWILKSTKQ